MELCETDKIHTANKKTETQEKSRAVPRRVIRMPECKSGLLLAHFFLVLIHACLLCSLFVIGKV